MISKVKNSLSKIIIALKLNKKILHLDTTNYNRVLLNVFWFEGLIYGYLNDLFKFQIFLKYSEKGVGLFENLIFFRKHASYFNLKNLLAIEKNLYVFLINEKGLLFTPCILKNKLGGFIIAKK